MNYKTTLLLITSFFLSIGCLSQKKNSISENKSSQKTGESTIQKIELTEQTRGTNRLITFSTNSVIVDLNGNKKTSTLSSSDWKNIIQEAELIDLEKLSTYEAPTTHRFTDGALASTIILTVDGKQYRSANFDSGQPPAELKAIYSKLKESSKNIAQTPERKIITR